MLAIDTNQPITTGTDEASHVLWKALSRIQEDWKLPNYLAAKMIHIKANTYGNWMKAQSVPMDKTPSFGPEAERVIAFIAIYRSLGAMFTSPADQLLWLKSPHPHLENVSPLDFICHSTENLFFLRKYLDYVRGRGA